MLVVSHDRRFLDTVCERLWVVDDGLAVPFDGGYRAWRAAVADGWTVSGRDRARRRRAAAGPARRARRTGAGAGAARAAGSARGDRRSAAAGRRATAGRPRCGRSRTARQARPEARAALSKDAYRRQREPSTRS